MRFLCLHGQGSNARIFQQQTAALRYELGDDHSYDFVNGAVAWETDRDLDQFVMGEEQTFAHCDPDGPESCLQALEHLERYIAAEGPYDGIMGFSQGANVALSWLLKLQREARPLPFRFGVFFSNPWAVYDYQELVGGRIVPLQRDACAGMLDLPTAHIWGSADKNAPASEAITAACVEGKRSVWVHNKGHEIPVNTDAVIAMGKTITRALVRASTTQYA
ncbi:uncharacterized protein BO66DRAFT_94168 [Aspergillus aculeatinus CBS 121060]|uniref:Uncharacterized protein n=1 Tax=Aspergillus aculeatinus CBS 121060 TaxID=1448322 RepID=A0ACD1H9F1_9EURO|nr:hypothetical protein BO66DRAFT_94168 [Aspergillus aculeatinus CBS 121060]RAH70042.1 hypothetical protein BO66DRAFT_94168 [Aspergillus aculeatinus CBS 121060]